jgi:predicted hotdog family 3-hydroxylacyl-ACP dehydratase
MAAMEFPAISALLPHAGGMLLLRRVEAHDEAETTCSVDTADSALFCRDDGTVPAYVAVEYMAQCIAAHGGLRARAAGAPVRPGLLLGTRRLMLHRHCFAPGEALYVSARHGHGSGGMLAFDCRLWSASEDPLAEGRLNVYVPDDPTQLLAGQNK